MWGKLDELGGGGESLCGIHESKDPKIQVAKHAPQKQHPTLLNSQ